MTTKKSNDITLSPEVIELAKELIAQGRSVKAIRGDVRNADYRKAYHGARQAGLRAEHRALQGGATAEEAKGVFERVKREELSRRLGR
jgi:hypothetical protein